ncbi:MAG: VWA domain-containing protein [Alphaproteobacteria bacterium]|jgi:uncharacterized protein YegL|nr:VWA domain-containing protein [Alphaproteobacteria bacterium]MBT5390089.1 VWA domain-containing protein [Alphaproteobacteria bacterium]MBT5541142.1 VWA domain-containing protein [Alphaproteobacteria bacterium]
MSLDHVEFVENPENRCPVVLILDTSESMEGAPMEALNAGLATFKYEVERDPLASLRVETAIITFGGTDATLLQGFKTMDDFTAPKLTAQGHTPIGHALDLGLETLEARKTVYKAQGIPYYRPWVILITDGAPTDGERWQTASRKLCQAEEDQGLNFFIVAVEGADLDILTQMAPAHRPPLALQDLQFKQLFQWLSASVQRVSTSRVGSGMLALPPVSGWAQSAA